MTTQPNDQQEPSMEEILSSIRRIIADEADAEGEQAATRDDDTGAPEAAAQDLEGEDDVPFDADEDEAGDEDVLELTEVVREGAEIVALDVALAQSHSIEQHDAEPDAAADRARDEAASDQAEPGEPQADAAEESPGGIPAFAAEPPADDHAAPSSIDEIRNDPMEDHETAMQSKQNGNDPLVSDQAAGAFAEGSQAVQRTPPDVAIADGAGRSVEQFAEDMMRPMLREWLDQNLPAMVERTVQREIRKMLRRGAEEE